ncbi:hypothetical protein [Nocardia sp. NPDC048505]|uniref:hypothetical protein n=1 Tax=unclassified Nocardia TaxID=2637762 RepID=UPI0034038152
MAIAKKKRRRIVVGSREFWWWIHEDWENPAKPGAPTLTVATDDRRIRLYYVLDQPEQLRHITAAGPEFRGLTQGGRHRRFRCPGFGLPDEVRPSDVAELITWCTEPGPLPARTDWRGESE